MNKQEKIEQLRQQINILNKEIYNLRKEIRLEKLAKGEYLKDLSEYAGKTLSRITALDSEGEEVYIPTDEFVEVTSDGKLYVSSFSGGIIEWDDTTQSYYHYYHFSTEKLDIVGFIDIEE